MGMLLLLLFIIIIFLLAALPLYLAVKFLGGKTTLFKAAVVNLFVGIVVAIIHLLLPRWGILIGFIVLLWFYREFFKLKWIKAFFAWFIEIAFIVLFWFLGITLGIIGTML